MNWLKYKKIYFVFSMALLLLSTLSLVTWKLNLGLDFTGGVILEYISENNIPGETLIKSIRESGIEIETIQKSESGYIFKAKELDFRQKDLIYTTTAELTGSEPREIRFEIVGPSIGPELVKKTLYAISIAALGILFWVALQFKSFKYGASAILAMLHDSFILIGSFSLLGFLYGAEIDFLFVTALLTTLSFSVHDTIVVFDRIREIEKKEGGVFYEIANRALSETMVRSLNNSFTVIFMLVALVLLGGVTIKWFAVALMIGTVLGTYSSPFVAVPLLSVWDSLGKKK